jgi:hypothetical protein
MAAWLTLGAGTTLGEITSTSGRVEAMVTQLNATTGQIVDQAFEETPGTTNILPAEAIATLDITESAPPATQPSAVRAAGTQPSVQGRLVSTALVNPPAGSLPEDTKDFSIEASGLSMLSDRSFECQARSVENRNIVLRASELGLAGGTPIRVRSTFVISAGIFLVTFPEGADDVTGTVSFRVSQQDDVGTRTLLLGTMKLFFDSAGVPQVTTSGDATQVIAVPFDFSDQSSSVEQAYMMLFPLISLAYEYDATVDEAFTLTAEIQANVDAATGGQGGSAFVGQVPTAFTDALDEFVQVDLGGAVDALAGLSDQQNAAGLISNTLVIRRTPSICGAFGLESLLGGFALTLTFFRRRFA